MSLARAVYSNNDIFLLDDPISALDADVRKKIINNVVIGSLRDKTRILVTHAIDFINLADRILIMKEGAIDAHGTYEELIENPMLVKLMEINKINNNIDTAEEGMDGPSASFISGNNINISDRNTMLSTMVETEE